MSTRPGLREVAKYQRWLNLAILATLGLLVAGAVVGGSLGEQPAAQEAFRFLVVIVYYSIQLFALFSAFMLARAV